jgi:hypothetical protein
VALNGLILRALDGRPEMWPWLTRYVDNQYHLWVEMRKTYPGLYYGIRDGGFMLLYCANLGAVHPHPTTRASFKNRALDGAVNYYARLQKPDGSWRWASDGSWIGEAMQPFMVGILLEGMIAVHKLTGNETVKRAIIKGAECLFLKGYNPHWRGTYYQVGGVWADGTNCETGCGAAANPFPPADLSLVAEARQLNATSIHAFGYAYLLSGDQKFKLWGDEIFNATYSGSDGYRALAHYRGKEYDECYRAGGKYLGYAAGQWGTTPPSPMPDPLPDTPPPVPNPNPNPNPTSYLLSGTVIENGQPLQGAVIGITDSGRIDLIGTTKTNAQGRFTTEINLGQRGYIRAPEGFEPADYMFDGSQNVSTMDFTKGTVTPPPPDPPPAPEYRIESLSKMTEALRTGLYQRMFGLGYAAWSEKDPDTKGNKIKFRRFS